MRTNSETQPVPLRIGLTGGIASGKSTVADAFAGLGATLIDTDVISREVVEPGQPALADIRHEFGDRVFQDDGALDRSALRSIIFSDDDARERLERIVHPRIRDAARDQAAQAGGDYQIIVVPLLVESPFLEFVDRVLVVDCEEDAQIRRLIARDAESEGQARRILAAQSSREDRLAIADDVIDNDGNLSATLAQVQALHEKYRLIAQQRRSA